MYLASLAGGPWRLLAQKEFWRPKPGEFWLKKNFGG